MDKIFTYSHKTPAREWPGIQTPKRDGVRGFGGERAEIISGITTNNPRRNWKKVAVLMMGLVMRQQQSNTQRRVKSGHNIVVGT